MALARPPRPCRSASVSAPVWTTGAIVILSGAALLLSRASHSGSRTARRVYRRPTGPRSLSRAQGITWPEASADECARPADASRHGARAGPAAPAGDAIALRPPCLPRGGHQQVTRPDGSCRQRPRRRARCRKHQSRSGSRGRCSAPQPPTSHLGSRPSFRSGACRSAASSRALSAASCRRAFASGGRALPRDSARQPGPQRTVAFLEKRSSGAEDPDEWIVVLCARATGP